MRRRIYFIAGIVVALVVALTVGLTVARGQGGVALPALTPSELLANVAQEAPKTTVVHGDIAWTNDLLGGAALALPGGDGGLASLLTSGSGRLWLQEGKIRFESQGASGDMVAVLNGDTAWLYSSQLGTATEYTLPAKPDGASGAASPDALGDSGIGGLAAAADLPQKIQEMVDGLAPDATLAVTTDTVAGRASYILTLTPTAADTLVGSVQAAFDGVTFLPLQVRVFAAGDAVPVLGAGFTSVSYDEVAAGMFDFTPPADATVEHTTLSMPAGLLEGMMGKVGSHEGGTLSSEPSTKDVPLTLDEAAAQAGFAPAVPADPTLPFGGAYVMTPPSGGLPGHASPTDPAAETMAPLVALRYGEGFGSVMLIETTVTDAQWTEATAALAQVPLFGTPSSFGGHEVYQLSTKLGSIVAWRQGNVVVLAAGSVSRADLEAFVAGIHE